MNPKHKNSADNAPEHKKKQETNTMKYAAVLGYGTVGSGVVKVINTNNEIVSKNAGGGLRVKHVLDLRTFPGDPVEEILTNDFNTILNDPEVDIVVETMGGLHPAYEFTKAALEAGKSACTSNKELVAEYGLELLQIAKEHGVNYLFEASCGGGIPIIRALMNSLTGDEILEITGILNGTTNYIMTQMTENGTGFDEALKDAQAKGFAELHPEADIEGYDPCRKISILSEIAYGKAVDYNDLHCEGITKIQTEDIRYAAELGSAIKLLASSVKKENGCEMMVSPYIVSQDSPLYAVKGVFNAVFVKGNMLGDAMFYGSGAGSLPTASAVVGDVVDLARNSGRNIMKIWEKEKLPLVPFEEIENSFFVRVGTENLEEAKKVFGCEKVIEGVIEGEAAVLTGVMKEGAFAAGLEKVPVRSFIRVKK